VDAGGEIARRAGIHVLDRVDPEAVEVGIGDPVLIGAGEGLQCERDAEMVDSPVTEMDVFQVEEIAFDEFGIPVPVVDAAKPEKLSAACSSRGHTAALESLTGWPYGRLGWPLASFQPATG